MRLRTIAFFALGVALLANCSGEEEPEVNSGPEAQSDEVDSRCERVSPAVLEGIAGGDFTPIDAAAVKSSDFQNAYMVAIRFEIDGDEEVGVWAVTSPTESGPVMSVDAMSAAVSPWPRGSAAEPMTGTEDGVSEARDCL